MNGDFADALPRWTRNAEFLIYLIPVGTISTELYDSYVDLIRSHCTIPISSLTRPGGYAAELSPFRSFSWDGNGMLRYRFVSTAEKIETFDGEDVHAAYRAIGVIGICHCPTTSSLKVAYDQFIDSIRHFPGLLVQKCFAFEHEFDVHSVEECSSLPHVVMFPLHYELDGGCSTVSFHLQVVLDAISVTIIMSLESTLRSAMRQQTQSPSIAVSEVGDTASFLLDTSIEPMSQQPSQQHQLQSINILSSSTPSTSNSERNSGVSSLFSMESSKTRRRQIARRKKLFGDYSLLLGCISDAIEHYTSAIDLLREEERRSANQGVHQADALWLGGALEGYVYCLVEQSQDKFMAEIIERGSEAVSFYAKAGVSDLESLLIQHLGWYCVAMAVHLSTPTSTSKSTKSGKERGEECIWVKRLLWESLERGLSLCGPQSATSIRCALQPSRQIQFLIEAARMLEHIGHYRRMALFLHEAASVLIYRASCLSLNSTPIASASIHSQRTKDLKAAMQIEQLTAMRLGTFKPHSQRSVTRRRLKKGEKGLSPDLEPWLIVRFHVLRQLLVIAKMLGEPALIGKYCIHLLEILAWCDDALENTTVIKAPRQGSLQILDQPQLPFTLENISPCVGAPLFAKTSIYYNPPSTIDMEIKSTKRYFTPVNALSSSAATVSNAAASLSSTIANSTPRILATPRQQFSAAVNAISTKASPFSTSSNMPSTPNSFASPVHIQRGSSNGSNLEWTDITDGLNTEPTTPSAIKSFSTVDTDAIPSVWNLRSREELYRLERRVLTVLETECMVLRPIDQLKLPSFIHVEKMELVYKSPHPILTHSNALQLYGNSLPFTQDGNTPPFFYNPFDKAQTNQKETEDTLYTREFPVHERIHLGIILSNPLGMEIEIQQLSAWVTKDGETTSCVETYPTSVLLLPREKQKSILLSLRPLECGEYLIQGCLIKILNIKTSFQLEKPILWQAISSLPLLRLSLSEVNQSLGMIESKTTEIKRVCMFSSETKQGIVHLHNIGPHLIHSLHIRVTLTPKGRSSQKPVSITLLSTLEPKTSFTTSMDTKGLTLQCRIDPQQLLSMLPLECGERMAIPFEVLLHSKTKVDHVEHQEHDEQLEWTMVYGPEQISYMRESKMIMELVSLPSLILSSVNVLPSRVFHPSNSIGGQVSLYDNSHCLVVVEILNPTETVFLLRMRQRCIPRSDEWDVEIGRHSTRRLVLELPRVSTSNPVLAELVDVEWKTYFGTVGRLDLADAMYSSENLQEQLMMPPCTFELVHPSREDRSGQESHREDCPTFPFHFFSCDLVPMPTESVCIQRLFQPCVVVVRVSITRPIHMIANVEVVIRRQIDADASIDRDTDEDSVLVSGILQQRMEWNNDSPTQELRLECLFLSEGCFEIVAHAQPERNDPEEPRIVCHCPLQIRVVE